MITLITAVLVSFAGLLSGVCEPMIAVPLIGPAGSLAMTVASNVMSAAW